MRITGGAILAIAIIFSIIFGGVPWFKLQRNSEEDSLTGSFSVDFNGKLERKPEAKSEVSSETEFPTSSISILPEKVIPLVEGRGNIKFSLEKGNVQPIAINIHSDLALVPTTIKSEGCRFSLNAESSSPTLDYWEGEFPKRGVYGLQVSAINEDIQLCSISFQVLDKVREQNLEGTEDSQTATSSSLFLLDKMQFVQPIRFESGAIGTIIKRDISPDSFIVVSLGGMKRGQILTVVSTDPQIELFAGYAKSARPILSTQERMVLNLTQPGTYWVAAKNPTKVHKNVQLEFESP